MRSEAEAKYGDDLALRDSLMSLVPAKNKRDELDAKIRELKAEYERKLNEALAPLLDERQEVAESLERGYIALSIWCRDRADDRRIFMGGHIILQKRKRPGDYDSEQLKEWAGDKEACLIIPSGKRRQEQILEYLRKNAPELLVYDEKTAVAEATRAHAGGVMVYRDAPVKLAEYTTQISDETFSKFLSMLEIELAVDSKGSSDGNARSTSSISSEASDDSARSNG